MEKQKSNEHYNVWTFEKLHNYFYLKNCELKWTCFEIDQQTHQTEILFKIFKDQIAKFVGKFQINI